MKKLINMEFRFILKDYFYSIKLYDFTFIFIVPLAISITIFLLAIPMSQAFLSDFIGVSNSILAILMGFTIATISILLASDSKSIVEMKNKYFDHVRGKQKQPVSLFKIMLTSLTFVALWELFVLILQLMATPFLQFIVKVPLLSKILFSCSLFTLLVALFLNISNITNIYHCFFREDIK